MSLDEIRRTQESITKKQRNEQELQKYWEEQITTFLHSLIRIAKSLDKTPILRGVQWHFYDGLHGFQRRGAFSSWSRDEWSGFCIRITPAHLRNKPPTVEVWTANKPFTAANSYSESLQVFGATNKHTLETHELTELFLPVFAWRVDWLPDELTQQIRTNSGKGHFSPDQLVRHARPSSRIYGCRWAGAQDDEKLENGIIALLRGDAPASEVVISQRRGWRWFARK